MNMKKRWMAALMAAVMSLSFLSGCGSDAESGNNSEEGGTTVLKMGHVYAEDYPMHIAMQEMSDYKGLGSLPRLSPGTSARSAGSFKGPRS